MSKKFQKVLKLRVDTLRKEGETMESIAKRAKVTRVYLYRILSGDCVPTLNRAQQIADGLGIKISVSA